MHLYEGLYRSFIMLGIGNIIVSDNAPPKKKRKKSENIIFFLVLLNRVLDNQLPAHDANEIQTTEYEF